MGNKSVSTGVDDTRGTPQGAHPFRCGHQGLGSFHSLPLLLSDQDEAPLLERRRRRSPCTHPNVRQTKVGGSRTLHFLGFSTAADVDKMKGEVRTMKLHARTLFTPDSSLMVARMRPRRFQPLFKKLKETVIRSSSIVSGWKIGSPSSGICFSHCVFNCNSFFFLQDFSEEESFDLILFG